MFRPAFIVEGQMEQKFLSQNCGKRTRVWRIGFNGKNVPIGAIAKRISDMMPLLDNFHPIVIVFDREGRNESSDEISQNLLEELARLGYESAKFRIGIPDNMIENWLLADYDLMETVFGVKFKIKEYDGKDGEKVIVNLLGKDSYKKTSWGVDMLKRMNVKRASENSPSLDKFINTLDFKCWWLR